MKETIKRNVVYYPPLLCFVMSGLIAIWLYYQHLCCDTFVLWPYLWAGLAALSAGWASAIYGLKKHGKLN
jgi:hypothetical protein